jgi:antitoxin MazE
LNVITKIQKWGNSQGLRLSKELLADVKFDVGDAVDVTAHDGSLVITQARRVRGGLDLAELVGRIPSGYEPEEVDWGPPVGREVW